ncbi:MAG: hypothetical protein K9L65_09510, partial [Chromatiaceae bacterium]|nr:hypothetical protein [Chromatiaceae bacterium]
MTDLAPLIDLPSLHARYEGFLLDAYGVLVDRERALPGAVALLEDLERAGCPWRVLTNAASRLPEELSETFAALGLSIPAERILTSGALLAKPAVSGDLRGIRALVLGPAGARRYAERAGIIPVPFEEALEAEALIIADQQDLRWPEHMDLAASLLLRRLDAGLPLR